MKLFTERTTLPSYNEVWFNAFQVHSFGTLQARRDLTARPVSLSNSTLHQNDYQMEKRWYSKGTATSKDEKNVNEADDADAYNNTHYGSLLQFVDHMLEPGAPSCPTLKSEFNSVRGFVIVLWRLRVRSNPKSSAVCSLEFFSTRTLSTPSHAAAPQSFFKNFWAE